MDQETDNTKSVIKTLLNLITMENYTKKKIADYILKSALVITESKYGFLGFIDIKKKIMQCNAWSKQVMKNCAIESYSKVFPLKKPDYGQNLSAKKNP